MNRIHVAFVLPGLDRIGGAEQQALLLAKGLAQRNWRVSVVALSGSGNEAAKDLGAAGIPFLSFGMKKGLADPRGWLGYQQWLRGHAPHIVHAHLPHAAWFTRWSRLFAPAHAQVDTIHTSATGTFGRRLGYRCSRWIPDRVTAVGHDVAHAYRQAGMLSETRTVVVPNGIDTAQWRPDPAVRQELRVRLGLRDAFLWFAAGRLEPVKNYPLLLRAFAAAGPSAHLAIAGAGGQAGALASLCASLGIEKRVRFLGFEPNVRRWMQAADAFVLASRWEGLPMTLLEAGACALPAVATNVQGSREVIVDGHTGLLATPDSESALSQAMLRLMSLDAKRRHTMGDQARLRVIEHYSLDAVLDRWEGLYREILAKP